MDNNSILAERITGSEFVARFCVGLIRNLLFRASKMQVSIRQVWDQHPKFRVSQCFGESVGATAHRPQWDAEYSSDVEGSTIAIHACTKNIEFISARNMTQNNFL